MYRGQRRFIGLAGFSALQIILFISIIGPYGRLIAHKHFIHPTSIHNPHHNAHVWYNKPEFLLTPKRYNY